MTGRRASSAWVGGKREVDNDDKTRVSAGQESEFDEAGEKRKSDVARDSRGCEICAADLMHLDLYGSTGGGRGQWGHCPDQARWAVWFRPLGRRGGMRSAVASGAVGLSCLGCGWDEWGYSSSSPSKEFRYGEKRGKHQKTRVRPGEGRREVFRIYLALYLLFSGEKLLLVRRE